jgi:outer membrane immunogenic protein
LYNKQVYKTKYLILKFIMKKIAFFIALACSLFATSSQLHAQAAAATTKGDVLVDFGVGFIDDNYNGYHPTSAQGWNYSNNNSNSNFTLPTFSVAVQKAFWDDITIGGQVAFNLAGSKHDLNQANGYYEHSKYSQTNLYIMARGEYHFNRLIKWPPKYDLYAGALIGGRISTANTTQQFDGQVGVYQNNYPNTHATSAGPAGGVFGGVRYYFAGNMSVYAEVGVGVTVFRTGLAWRL